MTEDVSVLVVGAGPAGLTTAITLARLGIDCALVDRRAGPSTLPRANVASTRTMELFRSWGLEAAVRARSVDVTWRLWIGRTLTAEPDAVVEVGLPSAEQAAVVSPTGPACVSQDQLEPVLLEHLRGLGPARVWPDTELVELEHGTTALLRSGGRTRRVRARYLVGADGAHSAVRSLLGVPMPGTDDLGSFVSAVFRAGLPVGERRYGIYRITHPKAAGNLVPAGAADRWVYGLEFDPARERAADFTTERLSALIRTATGVPDLRPRIERTGSFTFVARMVGRYRVGDVFLVGDAAHRVTPRGGTGMNTAIADGHNLGWKLAWVLRGWVPPELLDTYQAERLPVGRHNVARSADPHGSNRPVVDELAVDLGGRIPHVWLHRNGRRVSTLDLLGAGWTVFVGPGSSGPNCSALNSPGPHCSAPNSSDVRSSDMHCSAPNCSGTNYSGTNLSRPSISALHCSVAHCSNRNFSGANCSGPQAARIPVQVHELNELEALSLGVPRGGALWVRPDGLPSTPAPTRTPKVPLRAQPTR